MAGQHRKPSRARHARRPGRHRKPPSKPLTVAPAVAAVAVLAVGGVGFGHAIARGQAPRAGTDIDPSIVAVRGLGSPPATGTLATPVSTASAPAVTGTSATRPPDTALSPPPTPASSATPPDASPQATHPAVPHRPTHRPAVASVALRIVDIGPACYVQVSTRGGHVLTRRILHGGQQLVFRRHGLAIVLGNAGGVRISVDGHPARIAGKTGQVRKIQER